MQNSYIVDAFLSGVLWFALIMLAADVRARSKELSQVLNPATFGAVFYQVITPASLVSAPLIAIMVFLLWRFYALMVASASLGAGGIGLLVIMALFGAMVIFLDVLIVSIKHVRSADFAQFKREQAARQLLRAGQSTQAQRS